MRRFERRPSENATSLPVPPPPMTNTSNRSMGISYLPKDSIQRRGGDVKLGMVGLGRMGAGMTARLRGGGHEVVGYDRDPNVTEVASLEELVAKLEAPRV